MQQHMEATLLHGLFQDRMKNGHPEPQLHEFNRTKWRHTQMEVPFPW